MSDITSENETELHIAYASMETIENRLFFLRDVFEGLGNPNLDKVEFSSYGLFGFHEILGSLIHDTHEAAESIGRVLRR